MRDAVADLVRDGDTVAIEGFTHLICFAAGHEIIRQRKRDLTLARMTPDVIYDQMIAGGVREQADLLAGSATPASDRCTRSDAASRTTIRSRSRSRSTRTSAWSAATWPARSNLPFFPIRSYYESDIPTVNPKIVPMTVAVRRRDRGLRRPAAAPRRRDRPRATRRRERRRADLGLARLPEGGGVRRGAGHRRRARRSWRNR